MNAGPDPAELLVVADAAVDRVVPTIRDARDRAADTATKSSGTDMVTEYDRWSERTLVAAIEAARPHDGFLGEEGADRPGTSGVVWVIDPIDGTTNFLYDLPGFSISVAARFQGEAIVGVVHDPVRDERFRAIRGNGATRDDEPVTASDRAELATALVATGFSYEAPRRRAQAEVV